MLTDCTRYLFWIGAKFNVADDPTRDVALRAPSIDAPEWLKAIASTDYILFDEIAAALLYDESAPPLTELARSPAVEQDGSLFAVSGVPTQEVRRPGIAFRAPGKVLLEVGCGVPVQEVRRPGVAFRAPGKVLPET